MLSNNKTEITPYRVQWSITRFYIILYCYLYYNTILQLSSVTLFFYTDIFELDSSYLLITMFRSMYTVTFFKHLSYSTIFCKYWKRHGQMYKHADKAHLFKTSEPYQRVSLILISSSEEIHADNEELTIMKFWNSLGRSQDMTGNKMTIVNFHESNKKRWSIFRNSDWMR